MKILIFGKADFDVVQLKEKLKVELKESREAASNLSQAFR